MRTKIMAALLVGVTGVLGGCAVGPAGPAMYQQQAVQPAFAEDDGAPPAEYIVEGEPVYYESEPGVAFYPMFVDFPGSCFCIMPVRFYGGAWYAPGRVMVHNGHWAFHRPGSGHLNAWRGNHGVYGGHAAVRGHMERGPGGRARAVPPAGVHSQQRPAQQHVAPPRQAQPQVRPQQQQVRPQQQARPPQQARQPAPRPAPQRVPAKAPPKKACGGGDQPKC